MIKIFNSSIKAFLALLLIFSLGACSSGPSSGLEPFKSSDGRYGFLYPTGWTRVSVENGPEVLFHDLINSDETLSLVISKLDNEVQLEDLGSAEAVGYRMIGQFNSSDNNDRKIELISSNERESSGHTFYDLEYRVNSSQNQRHEIASVTVDRGYLFTLAASSSESRWNKIDEIYNKVVRSFTFFI